jgi:hypothetical protein
MNMIQEGLIAGNTMMMVPSSMIDNICMDNLMGASALSEINKKNKTEGGVK